MMRLIRTGFLHEVLCVFMNAFDGKEVADQRFQSFIYQPFTVTFPFWTIKTVQMLNMYDNESLETSELADGVDNLRV